jgi:DNA polymerase-3 subunit alpha
MKNDGAFRRRRTEAIFQFESSGMQEICRRLKPKELEDLAALNASIRPGPLDGGMVDDFIARHRGEKRSVYRPANEGDFEQYLRHSGLSGADYAARPEARRLYARRSRYDAPGDGQKETRRNGAASGKICRRRGRARNQAEKAEEIFNLMAQFADYGFNRSHSVAYAYLAFQTAYLKAHYPAYFYASVLSHEAQDSAKVYKYSSELRRWDLNFCRRISTKAMTASRRSTMRCGTV